MKKSEKLNKFVKTENLTETSKKIISNHIVRKSKLQKTNFINFLKNEFTNVTNITIEKYKNKDNNRNIIVGDFNTAKYVYTAHYDTCATLGILPNFICPKNIFLFLLIQILLGVVLVIPSIALAFLVENLLLPINELLAVIAYEATLICSLLLVLYLLLYGFPNKNNYNDNTSGVITLVEMINKMPKEYTNKVCFIFFDNEEKGLLGSKAFYKEHLKDGLNQKIIINFDCVSDGNNFLFIHKNASNQLINHINNYQEKVLDNKVLITESYKKAIFPSDHKKFPNYVGVGAFNKNRIIGLYLGRIHTYRDIVFDENNIFLLRDIFIDSLKEIS